MRKALSNRHLDQRPIARTLVALSLSASLAAFGCTTNRMPGNGEPSTGGPGVGPGTPTSGTSGSSSGSNPTPGPMTSSYNEALPRVTPRSVTAYTTADRAAAIMAQHQARTPKVLGVSSPSNGQRPYQSDGRTGQFSWPAYQLNPQVTVNSSATSGPTPVVTSGVGDGGAAILGGAVIAGTDGAVIASASNAGTNTAAAAPVFAPSTTGLTPTTAALPFGPGSFAAGAGSVGTAGAGAGTTVTAASGTTAAATTVANPTTTTAASSAVPTTTAAATSSPTMASASGQGTARALSLNRSAAHSTTTTSSGLVRVLNSNGRVVVTNIK